MKFSEDKIKTIEDERKLDSDIYKHMEFLMKIIEYIKEIINKKVNPRPNETSGSIKRELINEFFEKIKVERQSKKLDYTRRASFDGRPGASSTAVRAEVHMVIVQAALLQLLVRAEVHMVIVQAALHQDVELHLVVKVALYQDAEA